MKKLFKNIIQINIYQYFILQSQTNKQYQSINNYLYKYFLFEIQETQDINQIINQQNQNIKSKDLELLKALNKISEEKEVFTDYLSVFCGENQIEEDADETTIQQYQLQLFEKGFEQAQQICIQIDYPFIAPQDFKPNLFRPEIISQRLQRINEKKEEQMKISQEVRKRRIERMQQKAMQHEKRVGKDQKVREQKEIINRWKEERKQLIKKGIDESKLPTLEQVTRKVQQEKIKQNKAKQQQQQKSQ